MRTIVIASALTVIVTVVALVIVLAVLRAGIRRQERAACFTCHPPGLSTAIARRVLSLHTRTPVHNCHNVDRGPAPIPNGPSARPATKEPAS
jgi:hypothetical protein